MTFTQGFLQQGYYCLSYSPHTMTFVRESRLSSCKDEQITAYGMSAAEYLLLFPYWYKINDTGSFESVGKSTIASMKSVTAAHGVVMRFPIIEYMLRQDLETVLGMELDRDLVLVETSLNSMYVLTEHVNKSEGMFDPGDFVQLMNFLYRVDRAGNIQLIGENGAITIGDFFTAFQRLAGIIQRCSATLNYITGRMRADSQEPASSQDAENVELFDSMYVPTERMCQN